MAGHGMTRSQVVQSDTQLLNGIQEHLSSTTFNVQGSPQTAAQIVEVLQGRIDTAQTVVTTKGAFHAAVVADELKVSQTDAYVHDVHRAILLATQSPQVLSDCG